MGEEKLSEAEWNKLVDEHVAELNKRKGAIIIPPPTHELIESEYQQSQNNRGNDRPDDFQYMTAMGELDRITASLALVVTPHEGEQCQLGAKKDDPSKYQYQVKETINGLAVSRSIVGQPDVVVGGYYKRGNTKDGNE